MVCLAMTITLVPEQLKWLERQVAGGKFDSANSGKLSMAL
jgi:hypothetical protein